jgi:hypothetical protein
MIFVAVYELLHCLLCLKDATLVSFKTDFNSTSQMQKSVRYAMGGMRCVVRSSPAGNAKTCCILQWMSEEMQRCDTLSSLHLGGTQTALHVESHGEYYVLKLDVVASICVPFGMIRSFFW